VTNRIAIPIVALAVASAAGTAAGASSRDTLLRHHISYTRTDYPQAGYRSGASATFYTPGNWTTLARRDDRHVSFRVFHTACSYSVTFTVRQAVYTDETPAEHAAALAPASGIRLVDYGSRGTSGAWRVSHPASQDGRVHLVAARVDRQSLGAGARAWRETLASAVSRTGSECHAGTYRESLGPQIGNALATAAGRVYSFRSRG
jgi:hypothetical protein